jgi:uncharacterized protein DUF29
MAKTGALYDRDFVLWTEEQAAALRRAKGSNLPLDWENLAEEIESLGKSDRRELRSQITRILRHLLKLAVSPKSEPRGGWRSTIRDARVEIEGVLEDSPSLRREIADIIARQSGLRQSWRRRILPGMASRRMRFGHGSNKAGSRPSSSLASGFPTRRAENPPPCHHRAASGSGCLRRKLKSQPRSACRISRR